MSENWRLAMDRYDLGYARKGGIEKMIQLFVDNMDRIIDKMNEALAA